MMPEDSDKIEILYRLYEQPMYRVAFAVLKNSQLAEDAVSDAFMRIIDRLWKIKDPRSDKTKAYIIKVIKSTSINIYRKNKKIISRERPIDDDVIQIADTAQNVEEYVMSGMESQSRRSLINNLDRTDRAIITLRYENDLSWKEVAQQTSMTESAVRKRFERAKKKLIRMKGELHDEK